MRHERPVWIPSTNHAGLRGPLPEADWVPRETALALVEALKGPDWESLRDLERLTGVDGFSSTAERAYLIHGFPELEAGSVCRRLVERADEAHRRGMEGRSNGSSGIRQPAKPSASPAPVPAPANGYGFQRASGSPLPSPKPFSRPKSRDRHTYRKDTHDSF